MADRGEQIRRAGIYYLAGIILLALSFFVRVASCAHRASSLPPVLSGWTPALEKQRISCPFARCGYPLFFGGRAPRRRPAVSAGAGPCPVHWRRRFPERKPVQRRRRVDRGNGRVAGPVFSRVICMRPRATQYGDYHQASEQISGAWTTRSEQWCTSSTGITPAEQL